MFGHARIISAGLCSFFFSLNQYDTKNNLEYIKSSFSISYFERYDNSKSDYLQLLLNAYMTQTKVKQ